jgi:3-deoxy-manno-octulosonate cytidylyltransferase (CMP-KDO synthetase)
MGTAAQSSARIVAVIPARMNSSRFPGKMLADATGRPLIEHVFERARTCDRLHEVIIATDDAQIEAAAARFGARCIRTRADHPNGTSRIAEASAQIDADIIVNVQGDEPELEPALIAAAIDALLADAGADMSTVVSPFLPGEDPANPNIVKCVTTHAGSDRAGSDRADTGCHTPRALYFSRALIPFPRDGTSGAAPLKHVGLYVYRRAFLPVFAALPPTALERTEQLEQLRALEHGHAIAVAYGIARSHGIDTKEQYEAFVSRWRLQPQASAQRL